ncbi:MAG: peptidase S8 [Flavobacteriales bacterium]|nr:MAG: peptidase S8 [Flavobacteriales bacterium]
MKKYLAFLGSLILIIAVSAQNRYLVSLTDKGNVSSINIDDVLSPRAIKNHIKNGVMLNELDFPVQQTYLNKLSELGSVIKISKWLNAVIITSSAPSQTILNLPFVSAIEVLATGQTYTKGKFKIEDKLNENKTLNYDSTFQQNTQIGVDCIHDKGFLGENVLLAILDAGFQGMDTILAFDSLFLENRVVDMYDFVDDDVTVFEKHFHGTWVSSVIAGNQVNYIGSAPHVSLCLYITEDVTREVHEEEFDLVRGLERADSVGADLVNISLGYFTFDTLQGDYTYLNMDGQTTISALGIQAATSRGLVIVTSAGNSGPNNIATPCDADSILCVGATDTNNVIASFSSVGPSADGRVKPDVAATGKNAMCVDTDGTIRRCNGTSFSSPITCGMVACLMQSHPTLTMMDIVNSVRQSGHQYSTPDNLYGYGIPNACIADSLLTLLEVPIGIKEMKLESDFDIYPNPSNDYITIASFEGIELVEFYSMQGKLVKQIKLSESNSVLINCNDLEKGIYLVQVNHSMHHRLIIQ